MLENLSLLIFSNAVNFFILIPVRDTTLEFKLSFFAELWKILVINVLELHSIKKPLYLLPIVMLLVDVEKSLTVESWIDLFAHMLVHFVL